MSDTYEIKSLDDFLNVPENRVDACLYEFKTTLMAMRMMRTLNADLGHGETVMILFPSFTWVDDGKMDMSVQIQTLPVVHSDQASDDGTESQLHPAEMEDFRNDIARLALSQARAALELMMPILDAEYCRVAYKMPSGEVAEKWQSDVIAARDAVRKALEESKR